MRRTALAILTCLALLGCEADVTEVFVTVDADEDVRATTMSLEIIVSGGAFEAEALDEAQRIDVPDVRGRWPRTFGLVPRGGDPTRVFEIEVFARDAADAVVLSQRARSGYVEGEVRSLTIFLERGCRGVLCPASETCRAGECEDVYIDPASLPRMGSGTASDAGMDGAADAGTASDAGMDGAADACVPEVDACGDGLDQDCDGTVDEGVPESCNEIDDDCDGTIDEGLGADTEDLPGDGADMNCDGIDGDADIGVFVAPAPDGNDANDGSQVDPVATVARAITLTEGRPRREVYVAAGTISEPDTIVLVDGLGIYGGFDQTAGWAPTAMPTNVDVDATTGVVADGDVSAALVNIRLSSANATVEGESSYGARISNGAFVRVIGARLRAGAGADGAAGAPGADGSPAGATQDGVTGTIPTGCNSGGAGGSGGSSMCGGGAGGDGGDGADTSSSSPGVGLSGDPGAGELGGSGGTGGDMGAGGAGGAGMPGTAAAAAATTLEVTAGFFVPAHGGDGGDGGPGGGGGGGFGAQATFGGGGCAAGSSKGGQGGGGGGAGGCPGSGGGGGGGGGASIGVLVLGSATRLSLEGEARIESLGGGVGGTGGMGGTGAAGGSGGPGEDAESGGLGGRGGHGSGGAGGPGGPSIAVLTVAGASVDAESTAELVTAASAAGGGGGAGGDGVVAEAGPLGASERMVALP